MTNPYDYWHEGIAGSLPNAPNVVAYNGEDVKPIGRIENDNERSAIVCRHNEIVRRLSTPQPPPEAGSAGDSDAWRFLRSAAVFVGRCAANGDSDAETLLAKLEGHFSAAPAPKETP